MAKGNKNNKAKKNNSKRSRITKFFKGVFQELKKVNWLSKKDLIQHTGVVIGSIAIVTVIVWGMDLGLGSILDLILR